eukprot:COSAG06_NODE_6550_length_2885_cov_4.441493_3_plen_215_part_00
MLRFPFCRHVFSSAATAFRGSDSMLCTVTAISLSKKVSKRPSTATPSSPSPSPSPSPVLLSCTVSGGLTGGLNEWPTELSAASDSAFLPALRLAVVFLKLPFRPIPKFLDAASSLRDAGRRCVSRCGHARGTAAVAGVPAVWVTRRGWGRTTMPVSPRWAPSAASPSMPSRLLDFGRVPRSGLIRDDRGSRSAESARARRPAALSPHLFLSAQC